MEHFLAISKSESELREQGRDCPMVLELGERPASASDHRILLRDGRTYVCGIRAVVADLQRLSDALAWNLSQLSDSLISVLERFGSFGAIFQIRE